jgi:flagellar motor switch protein FliG
MHLGALTCLAILKTLSQAASDEVEWLLDMYFSDAGRSLGRRLGGEQKAADLLNQLDVVTESLLLNGLRISRPEAAALDDKQLRALKALAGNYRPV